MPKLETNSKRMAVGKSILANLLLSWTLLPFAIPPFRIYSLQELGEVLLWQGMGAVGWPFGLLGGFVSALMNRKLSHLTGLLFLSMYPTMLMLLILALYPKRWALVLLHVLLTGSFAAIWHGVLNGYDFMKG